MQKTTGELLDLLKKSPTASTYMEQAADNLIHQIPLSEYLTKLIEEKNLKKGNLIRLSGYKIEDDIRIEFTGLRPGEKLYEELLMDEEGMKDTANKMIHIGQPIQIEEDKFLEQLKELKEYVEQEPDDIREYIMRIVPTYIPKEADRQC